MAAAGGLFRSVYEVCISGSDRDIENRPYHRNCGCALHSRSRGTCPHASPKSNNVSYPMRRSKSEGWLVMATTPNHSITSPAESSLEIKENLYKIDELNKSNI
ncbi:hypothetical protein SLE2022_270530 [Rubroshorea leprosula]